MLIYRGWFVVAVSLVVFLFGDQCKPLAFHPSSCRGGTRCRAALLAAVDDIPITTTTGHTLDLNSNNNQYEELLKWLKSQNGAFVSDKIILQPSTLVGGGYGAFVTSAVDKDEMLFRIPRVGCCITLSDAFNDPHFGQSFQKLVEKAGQGGNTVVLAGYIAMERLKSMNSKDTAEDSKYSSYLATLPWERGINNQEHILYWTDDEVETLLKGTMCYGEAIDLRREVALAVTVLERIFSQPARPTFKFPWDKDIPSPPPHVPLHQLPEAVKAAFVCLLTRAFQDDTTGDDSNDEEKLVPLLDMLQHSEEPNVSHVMLKGSNSDVEVRSRRTLAAGEELLNQYRSELEESMPYHRFFTRFGFVPGIEEPILDLLRDKSSIFVAQQAEV